MVHRGVFSDEGLRTEFLDRFPQIVESAAASTSTGGLESLDGLGVGFTVDDAANAVSAITEGTGELLEPGLEAIIERFSRPVYLVQDNTFAGPPDDFVDSEFIEERLKACRSAVEAAIPSAGRVDLVNHRKAWVGTGWMVAPNGVATNRHVAREFAVQSGDAFTFDTNFKGQIVEANIDWYHEHGRPTVARFSVTKIIWIEPSPSFDLALLEIAPVGHRGESPPPPIGLASADEVGAALDRWVGALGYPARDSRNDLHDQQRIFDGIYDVKRLSPGKVISVGPDAIEHDCTTLGGSSGGCVFDLDTGKALAIHFGGVQGEENYGVKASDLAAIVERHVG